MRLSQATVDFIDHCRSTKNLVANTLRAYEGDLRDFSRFAGPATEVGNCDKSVIHGYVRSSFEERDLSAATVKRRIACVRGFFKWLAQDKRIEATPFQGIDLRIRLPKRIPRVLSHGEMQRLLTTAAGKPPTRGEASTRHQDDQQFRNLTTRVALELLYATGIRVGELVSITPADLDLEGGVIRIDGKGSKERRVYIPTESLTVLLRRYIAERARRAPASQPLLINRRDKPASTQAIRTLLHRTARDARIQGRVTPHMFRHTTATHLLESGVNLRYVQHLLGHENIATTQRYSHVNDSVLMRTICAAHPLHRLGVR